MLIGGALLISIIAALGLCGILDGFTGLTWLWLVPLSFVGSFLVCAVVAFAFLLICCKFVDQSKPQEHDSKFYRRMMYLYIQAILTVARVRIHTTGLEKTPKEGRFLLVCNHLDNVDPPVLLHVFKKSQLAFISKKENHDMFVVGDLMHKIMCQLINRENDREALKTILKCIQLIKDDEVSIGVFPEGGIKGDGKLHHLKGGVFKIAQKAGVPIVVCTIRNTDKVISNFLKLKSSDVYLHLVDVIPAEDLKGRTAVSVAEQVYDLMINDLGEEFRAEED